jgi:large subunit ribosomal protein L5
MTRLRTKYRTEVIPKLKEQFHYSNLHAVPRLVKVVINVGVGRSLQEPKFIETVTKGLESITGQKTVKRTARSSISGFKIRKGMVVGISVTLRGSRMEDFIDRLVNISLPRVRDFQGLNPKGFGQSGSYTLGLKEHTVFPETQSDEIDRTFGLEITVVTTAKTPSEGLAFLTALGFPFQR